jgi:aryl-alcohol dehydrogenase-like predicted oxidoreductase
MDYVRLGKTGLKVSPLCLGCMSFGTPGGPTHPWVIPEDEAQPFFRKAVESGINFFDTANHYNFGDSEEDHRQGAQSLCTPGRDRGGDQGGPEDERRKAE